MAVIYSIGNRQNLIVYRIQIHVCINSKFQYTFNPETGDWKHRQHQVFKDRKWLGHISYSSGKMTHQAPKYTPRGPLPADFQVKQLFIILINC